MRSVIVIGVMLCIMVVRAGTAAAQQKGPAEAVAKGLVVQVR